MKQVITKIRKEYVGKVAVHEKSPISSPKKWIVIKKHEYENMRLDSGKLLFDVDVRTYPTL